MRSSTQLPTLGILKCTLCKLGDGRGGTPRQKTKDKDRRPETQRAVVALRDEGGHDGAVLDGRPARATPLHVGAGTLSPDRARRDTTGPQILLLGVVYPSNAAIPAQWSASRLANEPHVRARR
eukprot:scaffold184949_cov31-Tisochrysis_lutea.AAC.1